MATYLFTVVKDESCYAASETVIWDERADERSQNRGNDVDNINVIHDTTGHTLTIWWDDSSPESGWLEFLVDGPNADSFAPAIENRPEFVAPSLSLYEVFKRALQQRDEDAALQAWGAWPKVAWSI